MYVLVGVITAPNGRDPRFQLVPPFTKQWYILRDGGWEELETAEAEHLRPAFHGLTWDDRGPCGLYSIANALSDRIFYDLAGFQYPDSGVMLGTMSADTDLAFWVTLPPDVDVVPEVVTGLPEHHFYRVPTGVYLEFVIDPTPNRWGARVPV